jgi:hypothetical protein
MDPKDIVPPLRCPPIAELDGDLGLANLRQALYSPQMIWELLPNSTKTP